MMDRLISKLGIPSRSRSWGRALENLTIADNYNVLEEVTKELKSAGFESSRLMVCFDFTESNDSTGAKSFNKKSLHEIGSFQNPYQQTVAIVGKTLESFVSENSIPCLAFGDAAHGNDNFCKYQDSARCYGFEEVLNLYKEFVPHRKIQGLTSFAPIIGKAVTILETSGGKHHVLLIITDGQILRENQVLEKTKITDAIVNASNFPLSIILVGVGDGPWDMVKEFVDNIPSRAFDNIHFVSFTNIMTKNVPPAQKVAEFARAALMKIPSQFHATRNLFGGQNGNVPQGGPLPHYGYSSSSATTATFATIPTYPNQVCCVCFINSEDLAFGCGHRICSECFTQDICRCPICRDTILIRVKLKHEHDQEWCYTCPPNRSNLKDMAFHCGHLTCSECGDYLDSCPTCGKTQDRIKLY